MSPACKALSSFSARLAYTYYENLNQLEFLDAHKKAINDPMEWEVFLSRETCRLLAEDPKHFLTVLLPDMTWDDEAMRAALHILWLFTASLEELERYEEAEENEPEIE